MSEKKLISDPECRKIELEILKKYAQFCDAHGLQYYLAYGTLLGAIRHQGFIPWDNDVDVAMPRPDYERLLKILKKEKVSPEIDALDYHDIRTFPFLKLIDNRTVLKEHFLVTEDSLGLYIDVFPMDGFPAESEKQKEIFDRARKLYKLYAFANYRFGTGANSARKLLKAVLYPFSRLVSSRKVSDCLNALCRDYDYNSSDMVGDVVWGQDEREIMPRRWFEPAYAEFEGCSFRIPAQYDKCLTQQYGDYMQLPPEDEREIHFYDAWWKDGIHV